ncbi:MAG: hypothetical protein KF826_14345 [Xanthobacteraceae bacterium]|nr:hypothetical protein [Xanthobacteraceae bacterium]MBX3535524.1 hypothetical protein [Xanthobacteraceae bacterium]MCW5675798.1 hypothetical protein [Xanthobacteraceae bacterium]MCW5679154.1 hypothetical protein [Xanthobacteraceae bacterium]
MRDKLPCVLLLALIFAAPASAQQNTSQYTSVATKTCKKFDSTKVAGDEIANAFECRGLPGYSVVVGEDDLRTVVSIGVNRENAKDQLSLSQTFNPFNSVHDTLEWRIDGKTKKPFATIQRWYIADNADLDKDSRPRTVQLLVVTRTPPGRSCNVAYIDVRANENPNLLAQQAADDLAQKFDCTKDKVHFIGNKGRAAELAARK